MTAPIPISHLWLADQQFSGLPSPQSPLPILPMPVAPMLASILLCKIKQSPAGEQREAHTNPLQLYNSKETTTRNGASLSSLPVAVATCQRTVGILGAGNKFFWDFSEE